ncbi:uncharacterized protein LAESUDRAFT_738840 [Laetiporus sulphureus 93-53]|uniref:DASH complex subunit ASK1 n=1 Tax=Laetiporus sulphureus 93-53 TaxID=1314785 RepID=A0A165C5C6_9APHY|nr:uncharacterized protein LAESUDRAFT_738840 [Laetiporus sulphureus 93-53]KZT02233.1 hypothetical protein LAESUDRAFT_738840 [Laetiporus sulphureus 93-53]
MPPTLRPIEPKTSRWEPTPDPSDIVIPGLDTTAPVNDQIQQIEHLITLQLQKLDANFAKMQDIMANRILPAVKRYAVGTEPVREAAKFWTTFYEQAAQIRVPTYEDYSSLQDQQDQEAATGDEGTEAESSDMRSLASEGATTPTRPSRTFHSDEPSTEVSFLPHAALSSTPATTSRHRSNRSQDDSINQNSDATPSWTASMESPLVRLDREIQSLAQEDPISAISYKSAAYDESQDITQRQIPPPALEEEEPPVRRARNGKGKARESSQGLLHDVLRRNAGDADSSMASPGRHVVSPLKFKPKTPILKNMNPYLPPGTKPNDWTGVVDLADPTVSTPSKGYESPSFFERTLRPHNVTKPSTPRAAGDDSLDMDYGMSPPVTMAFARLPQLGQTAKKDAAQRITQDLLSDEQRDVFGGSSARLGGTQKASRVESSASTLITPPSLSRYTRPEVASESSTSDHDIDSMIRRIGLEIPGFATADTGRGGGSAMSQNTASEPYSKPGQSSASIHYSESRATARPSVDSPAGAKLQTPVQFSFHPRYLQDDELQQNLQDDDDSMDSLDNEDQANPSPAFFVHAQQDDSFDDDDDDSFEMDNEAVGGGNMVHAFLHGPDTGDGFDDDSFDDMDSNNEPEEETVFGVPPAQRLQIELQRNEDYNLRMMGANVLQDTIGISHQMAQAGMVDETPTPYTTNR